MQQKIVMPGLDPGIHVVEPGTVLKGLRRRLDVDPRIKSGDDKLGRHAWGQALQPGTKNRAPQ
ncbi:hypothetical protein ACLBXM_01925 [Xanthobacteraceae bacterium A53D]